MMIQLPDGNWADAETVLYLSATTQKDHYSRSPKDEPYFIVHLAKHGNPPYYDHRVKCRSLKEAQRRRDAFAELVNKTLKEQAPRPARCAKCDALFKVKKAREPLGK
jgi:hypothetical protein